ncbi:MAG: lamin tail domain-containing protein [Candidatus Aureabacteria bacterium]|nr:lamin tail domain-containing protein [Candidatus Auribacterota bacterium]
MPRFVRAITNQVVWTGLFLICLYSFICSGLYGQQSHIPPSSYEEWIALFPDAGSLTAREDDPDNDGWSNIAEYQYWTMTGENTDPGDPASGGQAIELEAGINLIGISADVCYYVSFLPGEAERSMIPATYPDNYVEVSSIHSLLSGMGIADKVQRIMGWHPDPEGGRYNAPATYENSPFDTLRYLAGGYGYWIEISEACAWKISGKPRLKALCASETVKLYPGWNLVGDLIAQVHYTGNNPAAGFGSDETGRIVETNMCDYLRNLIYVNGSPIPGVVEAMVAYDRVFPFVHSYYAGVPDFLQTLTYAGPGMGLLIKVNLGISPPGSVILEYPSEQISPFTPTPPVTPTASPTPTLSATPVHTSTPTPLSTPTPILPPQRGSVVINELVTDPLLDWNDTSGGDGIPFNEIPGDGTVDSADEWIEIYNKSDFPVDLSGWSIYLIDSVPSVEELGRGTAILRFSEGSGLTSFQPAAYLVIGDPAGNLSSSILVMLRDPSDAVMDTIEIGDDYEGDGDDDGVRIAIPGDIAHESVARFPNGIDSDPDEDGSPETADRDDFVITASTIGTENAVPPLPTPAPTSTRTPRLTRTPTSTPTSLPTLTPTTTGTPTPLPPSCGSLQVLSSPVKEANILLDYTDTGRVTDCVLSPIHYGTHTISVFREGYPSPAPRNVYVAPHETGAVEFCFNLPTGTIDVSSSPVTGARIHLDYADTRDLTDATLHDVSTGTHSVLIRRDGYPLPPPETVIVREGETATASFELSEASGSVHVRSIPIRGAEILIDYQTMGQVTDATIGHIGVGTHEISVRSEGYVSPPPQGVHVQEQQVATATFLFALSPWPEPTPLPPDSPRNIVINEIMYAADKNDALTLNDHEYMELYNRGTQPITTSGWVLRDKSTTAGNKLFQFPAGAGAIVMPHAACLVVYAADWPGTDDLDLSDGRGAIRAPEWSGSDLTNSEDCIRIYTSSIELQQNSETIVDFVAFSEDNVWNDDQALDDHAAAAGIWVEGEVVDTFSQSVTGRSLYLEKDGESPNENNPVPDAADSDWEQYSGPAGGSPGESNPPPTPTITPTKAPTASPTRTPTRTASPTPTGPTSTPTATPTPGKLEIHHIQSLNSDATLIISPVRETMLIDTCGDGQGFTRVLPYVVQTLKNHGADHLDYIVASNYRPDRIGGIDEIIYGLDREPGTYDDLLPAVAVYDRGWSSEGREYDDYVRAAGAKRLSIEDGTIIDLGCGVSVTCVGVNGNGVLDSPYLAFDIPGHDPAKPYSEEDFSIALKITYGNFGYFTAGDLPGLTTPSAPYYHDIETSLASKVGPVDVYRVNQRGSWFSSNQALVSALDPSESILARGLNPYGNPHPAVVERLRSARAGSGSIHAVESDAPVVVESDGSGFEVSTVDPHASEVNVYFAQPVDRNYMIAGGVPAKGAQNIRQAFINRIQRATEKIDICMSKLRADADEVVTALITAKQNDENLAVRVIVDRTGYEYPAPSPTPGAIKDPRIRRLEDAGIPVQCDWSSDESEDMHNKFAVFDCGGSSLRDDWVWCGSLHWFEETPGTGDSVYLEARDADLAAAFAEEFDLMWDSAGTEDDALYHSEKYDHPPSQTHFIINGRLWEFYPGPRREDWQRGHLWPMREMVKHVDMTYPKLVSPEEEDPFRYGIQYPCQANHEFLFQIGTFEWCRPIDNPYYFSPGNLYAALDRKKGMGIFNIHGSAKICGEKADGAPLCDSCPPAGWPDSFSPTHYPHQEYGIVDGFHMNSAPSLFYGSARWTIPSQTWNDETTLLIWDPLIVNQFVQNFAARMEECGATPPELKPRIRSFSTEPPIILDQIYAYDAMPLITISGYNFKNYSPGMSVQVDAQCCLIESATANEIHARFPGGVGPGHYGLTVTNPNGWSATLEDQFTIQSLTPLPTPNPTSSPSPIPTVAPSPTMTPVPTGTPSPTKTPTPTGTPTAIPTEIPTRTPTITPLPPPVDSDGDGLMDYLDPCPHVADCDHDGLADGEEDVDFNGSVDPGETDPANPDSDGDGISDGSLDPDGDGPIAHGADTDPLNPDTTPPELAILSPADGAIFH